MYTIDLIKKEVASVLEDQDFSLVVPPQHIEADFAISIGDNGMSEKLAKRINDSDLTYVDRAESAGPFLNIFINKKITYGEILENVVNKVEDYGRSDIGKGETVIIEYSSPNIAKPLGVGHLRTTIVGEVLSRLYEFTDHIVVRENFLGDWGTQYGQLIFAYQNWGDMKEIKKDPLTSLKDLYVEFQEKAKKDNTLQEKARNILKKMEEGNKDFVALWKKFRDLSVKEFKSVYDKLGIRFNNFSGESLFIDKAKDIIEICLKENVCNYNDTGEVVVDLDDLPSFLLRKGDGSTLYITRDLAALADRIDTHKPKKVLYVVGNEQSLHFKQLFTLAEQLSITNNDLAEHVNLGLLTINGKKMSTRGGTSIELTDLLKESKKRSKNIIEKKNPKITGRELDRTSSIIGIGAVFYNILRQSRSKDVSFDWDKALNLHGESSAYLQYTYVRIKSILNKLNETEEKRETVHKADDFIFEEKEEFSLVKNLMLFPEVIRESVISNEPQKLTNYLENLASDFNSFYNKVSIKDTEEPTLKWSRAILVRSVAIVLKSGLKLLNIKIPKRM